MPDIEAIRLSYMAKHGVDPDSIPGKRCAAGEWDNAPGFIEHRDGMLLRERAEDIE